MNNGKLGPDPLVKIENLTKEFNNKIVIDNINLTIEKNTITALTGPNGAGKTTLLKIISGLIIPDRGKVELKTKTGLVYNSETSFYNQLTVKQNLVFWYKLYNRHNNKNIINEIIEKLELKEFTDIKFEVLSSGIKQKLSIARALLSEPGLLLIDELTRSVDFISSEKLHNLIVELNKEKNITVFFVSHNKEEIEKLSNKIVYIDKGRIIKEEIK